MSATQCYRRRCDFAADVCGQIVLLYPGAPMRKEKEIREAIHGKTYQRASLSLRKHLAEAWEACTDWIFFYAMIFLYQVNSWQTARRHSRQKHLVE
jgi:hypothetical protein